ncbi:hypothetical protein JCM19237_2600 [Photobacterium aphoticum]|uniref:Uncharacterized protein n=1 Tax=Photobacterium aphoticum TaxID=754436 RepID=A0A090QXE5_9GAMM|nr:hypothetical protein JCM19237_2600 [Photobacterium aphoticum]
MKKEMQCSVKAHHAVRGLRQCAEMHELWGECAGPGIAMSGSVICHRAIKL